MPFRSSFAVLSPSWNPVVLDPLAWIDNSAAVEDALPSLLDRSGNSRHFTVSGVSTARPRGLPMNMGFGGQPAIRLDSSASTYAVAPGTVGDWPAWHLDDFTIIVEGYCWQFAGTDVPFITCWSVGSSNENAIFLGTHASNNTLRAFITSTTGGGTSHLPNAVTANGTLRPGDRFTAIWRRAGTTSRLYLRRKARFPLDVDVVTTDTDTITGTINTGAPVGMMTIGSNRLTTGTYADVDISDVLLFNRSITDDELNQYVTWSTSRYDFPWINYASTNALTVVTDFNGDHIHLNDTGHAKFGASMWANQQAIAAEMGLTSGIVRIATCGDSRMDGFTASGAATTGRQVRANLAAGASYIDTPVGPASPGGYGGVTFALSSTIERGHAFSASPGFSYRTPSAGSIDQHMAPGELYRNVDIAHFLIGINDLNATLNAIRARDHTYERYLSILYMQAQVQEAASHAMGVSLLTEPSTGLTATGYLQRAIFARNREYHALVRALRRQGIVSAISNLHDDTYNP